MTATYSSMVLDPPVLQGVIDQLKLATTPDELKKQITVDTVINTQLLVITVQDPNAERAAAIANAMATGFAARITTCRPNALRRAVRAWRSKWPTWSSR